MNGIASFRSLLIVLAIVLRPAISSSGSQNNIGKQASLLREIRGGATNDSDDERYSRQVYTLGARAHGLVRSSTAYVDGPPSSGLVYECAKNLALSGVRNIVVLTSEDSIDQCYHDLELDDLGKSYMRAAMEEHGMNHDDEVVKANPEKILVEYLRRLNPSVTVSTMKRSDTTSDIIKGSRGVVLCVDRPYDTQVKLNKISRKKKLPFVAVETAGVYGRVFCDFGPSFEVYDADGEAPLVTPLDRVEKEDDSTILVHCLEGEKHDVSKGDTIQFTLSNGDAMKKRCSVLHVNNPKSFTVQIEESNKVTDVEGFISQINNHASSFSRVKIPQIFVFQPLETVMASAGKDGSLFTPCDLDKSFDANRRSAIVSSFQTLSSFVQKNKLLPKRSDFGGFRNLFEATLSSMGEVDDDTNNKLEHCRKFVACCAAKLTPAQTILGAIGAQETLKAATGLYNPVHQILLYDCDELLDKTNLNDMEECGDVDYGAKPLTGCGYILGQAFEQQLMSKRIFVVGAGAIGCEILKNLASMKVATAKEGCIVLTDMDSIEHSNLSRQLLFRDADIGKFKSAAAKEAVLRINPAVQMDVHTAKVGETEHGPFDDNFWSNDVDVVLNALDNVEARLYMDQQCVANQKALVDAGTMGAKGNVQVVVPHLSESYGSSVDPPEPAIPVCTLKNFPYAIAHTIQWGRDLFDGLFERRPRQANDFVESLSSTLDINGLVTKLLSDVGEDSALESAVELSEDLSTAMLIARTSLSTLREAAIKWAVELANQLYYESIKKLLQQHPINSVDEDGEPFWSGSRKVPKMLLFSKTKNDEKDSFQSSINENLVAFVQSAARLRMETFFDSERQFPSGQSIVTVEEAEAALTGEQMKDDPVGEEEAQQEEQEDETSTMTSEDRVLALLSSIDQNEKNHQTLSLAEFEKDDESNGHVDFVTAASNLRALCFGIPPVDTMETRRVAGKIVPAMITTTALVSALSCIEFLKLVQNAPLSLHRNAFLNLALPFFASTSPLPAEEISELRGRVYTIWDRLVVSEGKKSASSGGITLKRFLSRVKKEACDEPDSIDISTVSYGPYMIYANFLHEGDKQILRKSVWDLVDEAITEGDEFDAEFSRESSDNNSPDQRGGQLEDRNFLDLTVIAEDFETGEEVELPPVRLNRSLK